MTESVAAAVGLAVDVIVEAALWCACGVRESRAYSAAAERMEPMRPLSPPPSHVPAE